MGKKEILPHEKRERMSPSSLANHLPNNAFFYMFALYKGTSTNCNKNSKARNGGILPM